MKQEDYKKLLQFKNDGGGLVPVNDKAYDIVLNTRQNEVITLKECTARDIKFHRAYFSLLNYIYEYLPDNFKEVIEQNDFYNWLKHIKGDYKIKYKFKDGTTLVEYDSISFGNKSQKEFEEYVKKQLPFIYENVIGAFYSGDKYNVVIENIEKEFEKYLSKL